MDPGERRARFEELALPLAGALHHAALALTGRDAEARDIVQEAYLRAWRSFHTYVRDDNFKAWIFLILRHAWIDSCRKRNLDPVLDPPVEPAAPGPPAPVDLDAVADDDLRRAFSSLASTHRLLVLLCDLQSMSYREAAMILGIPIGSVMSGLHHARRHLRRALGGG